MSSNNFLSGMVCDIFLESASCVVSFHPKHFSLWHRQPVFDFFYGWTLILGFDFDFRIGLILWGWIWILGFDFDFVIGL